MSAARAAEAIAGWEVAQTVHRLFQHLDDGRFEALAALFVDGGIWHRQGADLIGPGAVLEAMRSRPADLATRHLVANIVVELSADGAEADARYYLAVFDHIGEATVPHPLRTPHFLFLCDDRLRDTAEGWRFARRAPRLLFARPDEAR